MLIKCYQNEKDEFPLLLSPNSVELQNEGKLKINAITLFDKEHYSFEYCKVELIDEYQKFVVHVKENYFTHNLIDKSKFYTHKIDCEKPIQLLYEKISKMMQGYIFSVENVQMKTLERGK